MGTLTGKAAKKGLRVMFMSDKKLQGDGAQCTAECLDGAAATTTAPTTTSVNVDWSFGVQQSPLCVKSGDEVVFNFTSGHNVNWVDKTIFDSCNGIPDTTAVSGPIRWTAPQEDGDKYAVCGVPFHCSSGKMKIHISINNCEKDCFQYNSTCPGFPEDLIAELHAESAHTCSVFCNFVFECKYWTWNSEDGTCSLWKLCLYDKGQV